MTLAFVLLTAGAIGSLLAGGYLLGVRQGKEARQALVAQAEALDAELSRRSSSDASSVQAEIARALAPILDRERIGNELARIETGNGTLGELPRLLDSIAVRGGFNALLLGDEVGLPLAATTGARDVDAWAGGASLLLSLSDRLAQGGAAPLSAVLLQDESSQLTVHRIFRVGKERYILSAASRGQRIGPDALDAALGKVEAILDRRRG